jgi:hypothetical protein
LCWGITGSRAFHVQLNTTSHHLHVTFLGTWRSTMITNRCTLQAGINACFVSMISSHKKKLKCKKLLGCKNDAITKLETRSK